MGARHVEDFIGTATVLAFGDAWELNQDVLVQDAARTAARIGFGTRAR